MSRSSYFRRELRPPARTFFLRELRKLSRADRKGWAKADCPFHKSKSHSSLSVNLDSGAFHCFGCGAHGGDVLAFMMLRYGYTFKTAAQLLGCWREDLTREERMRLDDRVAKVRYEREQADKVREAERHCRLVLRDELHTTVRLYLRIDGELQQIGPQAEGHYWGALSHLLDDWRMTESDYCCAARLEDPYE